MHQTEFQCCLTNLYCITGITGRPANRLSMQSKWSRSATRFALDGFNSHLMVFEQSHWFSAKTNNGKIQFAFRLVQNWRFEPVKYKCVKPGGSRNGPSMCCSLFHRKSINFKAGKLPNSVDRACPRFVHEMLTRCRSERALIAIIFAILDQLHSPADASIAENRLRCASNCCFLFGKLWFLEIAVTPLCWMWRSASRRWSPAQFDASDARSAHLNSTCRRSSAACDCTTNIQILMLQWHLTNFHTPYSGRRSSISMQIAHDGGKMLHDVLMLRL